MCVRANLLMTTDGGTERDFQVRDADAFPPKAIERSKQEGASVENHGGAVQNAVLKHGV